MIVPLILAGGSGTRLWPLSREMYPKQLIDLIGEDSMLQCTIKRLKGLDGLTSPLVICNENHRFMVAEQLRELGIDDATIFLEPVGRNTAPAVAIAALYAKEQSPDAHLLILPADHYIKSMDAFHHAVKHGTDLAARGFLTTFGIVPDRPETGYGYIRKGAPVDANAPEKAARIHEFVEKPDRDTAETYVASGEYLWNSGMFLFNAAQAIAELETFAPDILAACRNALEKGKQDLDFFRLDHDAFAACPSDSIDYAVMEKTTHGAVVPMDAGWNDLGSWEALWQIGTKDESDNVIHGDVILHNVSNSFFHAHNRVIAAIGLKNHIVVDTADAVLVAPIEHVQDVKHLVNRLKKDGREEAAFHKKVYRPWGSYESIDMADRFQVKRITVKPGAVLSLQKHHHRSEHWIVVSGTALVTRDDQTFILKEDESTYIPLGAVHRLENPGKIPLELIEVQTGPYLGEDDIVRLEDLYGR